MMHWLLWNGLIGCGEKEELPEPEATPVPVEEPAEEPCDPLVWYLDTDEDGFGDPYNAMESCTELEGYVENNTDCDDSDAEEFPAQSWYRDSDGDGFGSVDFMLENCSQPLGYVVNHDDCDDEDSSRNPDSFWYLDADEDGYGDPDGPVDSCLDSEGSTSNALDCNDDDSTIHPQANEICDFIDNDCDGLSDDDDPSLDTYTQIPIYVDADNDGFGTTEYLAHGCQSTDQGAYIQGDCDDENADVFPGNFEIPDDVDQNCDGDSQYQNINYTTQGLSHNIQQTHFGRHISSGDFNGDGVDDLFIGMPYHDQDPSLGDETGKIIWVDGTETFDLSDIGEGQQYWIGESEGDRLGRSVSLVGDMDGDGLVDALIGSRRINSNAGAVYLVNSTTVSGDISTAPWYWGLAQANSYFGENIIPAGDIDADGLSDVLVSAAYYDTPNKNIGAVFVLRGAVINVSHDPLLGTYKTGLRKNDFFGYAMSRIGDTDGDGIEEFAISAPYSDEGGTNTGDIYLLHTSELTDSAISLEDCTVFRGEFENDKAGEYLNKAGDINGDGHQDFFIVSYNHENSNAVDGALYLIYGQTTFGTVNSLTDSDVKLLNEDTSNGFATSVVGVGDMNGDGADDFVLGNPYADIPSGNRGHVLGYYGGALSGIHNASEAAAFILHGSHGNEDLGFTLSSAGDRDGDGFADIWIGAPGNNSDRGAIYLFSGFMP